MKLMFFCFADEMRVELAYWSKYFRQFPNKFVVTPLIKIQDKSTYQESLTQLSLAGRNTQVAPVYIKSADSSFRNLLNPKIFLNDFISIFEALNRTKPDVVVCYYVNHAFPLAFFRRFLGYSLCVVAMGSDINLENSPMQRLAKKFVYQNCDHIFAASWKLKEKIENDQGIPVIVTPSSTDTSFFKPLNAKAALREKWGIAPEKNVIISVARLDKNKAVDIQIKALKNLNRKDALLLIAGEGPEKRGLEALASNLGVTENVRFLGFKTRSALLDLYNLSDIFALSSYAEGLPRVLIEAMSCGCIPVSTDVGSVSTVVSNGENGFIVPSGNPQLFSEQLNKIMSFSQEKKQEMQTKARQTVVEKFDSKKVLNLLVSSVIPS